MKTYTQEELAKLNLYQLKSAKKHFYKQTKRLGIIPTPDELSYIIRLRAELAFRRAPDVLS